MTENKKPWDKDFALKDFVGMTITGRITSGPNDRPAFHEIPKYPQQAVASEKMIREAFDKPDEGMNLVKVDFAEIERRVLAQLVADAAGVSLEDAVKMLDVLATFKVERMF